MKIPVSPPDQHGLINEIFKESPAKFQKILSLGISPAPNDKYYHWDKVRHLRQPDGLNHKEWWFGIKSARKSIYQGIFTSLRI